MEQFDDAQARASRSSMEGTGFGKALTVASESVEDEEIYGGE